MLKKSYTSNLTNWQRTTALSNLSYEDNSKTVLKKRITISKFRYLFAITLFLIISLNSGLAQVHPDAKFAEAEELQIKANGFKGIWYMNQPSNDEYVYKYSGGKATYTVNHRPIAIYSKKANKTFFCFGGTNEGNTTLFHNISYFDHKTGEVANPTILLDKHTTDAHDNPVISIDNKGHIWIFSTSHGTNRPSYIYKSNKPYDIEKFTKINATEMVNGQEKPFDNFSYFQVYYEKGKGFIALFTKYNGWSSRVIGYNTSKDGVKWNEWKVLGKIDDGHYQVSSIHKGKISVAFDYHPKGKGLNYRTNLYYLETKDFGETWQTAEGQKVNLPLTKPVNPALIKDFKTEGLICYVKDLNFDKKGNPIIMVISSKGYKSGPENNPRTWEIFSYNKNWKNSKVTTSENNYDTGSLYVGKDGSWQIVGPTKRGPQHYNPGGEVVIWESLNQGETWVETKQLTKSSSMNHNYVRRPLNNHPDFYGLWADGHGRKPSESYLYFCNKNGEVFQLPRNFTEKTIKPHKVTF